MPPPLLPQSPRLPTSAVELPWTSRTGTRSRQRGSTRRRTKTRLSMVRRGRPRRRTRRSGPFSGRRVRFRDGPGRADAATVEARLVVSPGTRADKSSRRRRYPVASNWRESDAEPPRWRTPVAQKRFFRSRLLVRQGGRLPPVFRLGAEELGSCSSGCRRLRVHPALLLGARAVKGRPIDNIMAAAPWSHRCSKRFFGVFSRLLVVEERFSRLPDIRIDAAGRRQLTARRTKEGFVRPRQATLRATH